MTDQYGATDRMMLPSLSRRGGRKATGVVLGKHALTTPPGALQRAPLLDEEGRVKRSVMKQWWVTIALAALGLMTGGGAQAQQSSGAVGYPSKPLKMAMPFPARGPTDVRID